MDGKESMIILDYIVDFLKVLDDFIEEGEELVVKKSKLIEGDVRYFYI